MEFIKDYTAKIVFGDGTQYFGYSFGAPLDTPHICEIVFNTSMVGYQEIVSDPSYTYQAVTMTYPIIGNYGIADDDFYHYDTPLTVAHEREALMAAGFAAVEELGVWGCTHTLKAVK